MPIRDLTNGNIQQHKELVLHTDGACEPKNPGGVAVSAWALFEFTGKTGTLLAEEGKVVRDGGPQATNNFAEYCALGFALRWLSDQGWRGSLRVRSDSQLLINQVLGNWQCKAEHLQQLRKRIWELLETLDLQRIGVDTEGMMSGPDGDINPTQSSCVLEWVRREHNTYADELCSQTYQAYMRSKRASNR